jgi:DNA polymerase elongation subunit (family B)
MEPVRGLHYGVCDVDFASLYPNLIRTFNISPETKVSFDGDNVAIAANGARFRTDVEGVFPFLVSQAMDKRRAFKSLAAKLKDGGMGETLDFRRARERSDAYKVLAKGMYGCLGSPWLRYYDRDCAEAVTLSGSLIIKRIIRYAEMNGYNPLYGDTDSGFLRCLRKEALRFNDEVAVKVIDRWVANQGGKSGLIRLEIDEEYERMVFVAKKRYFGKRMNAKSGQPPDVKGLE